MSPTPYPFLKLFNGFSLLNRESIKSLIWSMRHCTVWHLPAPPALSPSYPLLTLYTPSHFLEPSMFLTFTSGPDPGTLEGTFISHTSSPN